MSTPLTNKKRRIDAAASALSKPFRSPFKIGLATTPTSTPDRDSRAVTEGAEAAAQNISPNPSEAAGFNLSLSTAPRFSAKTCSSTVVPNTDVDIRPILKTQRKLEARLREIKEELHVIQQARKIEKDSLKHDEERGEIDGELKALAMKWKMASRMAADELFGVVKDRVNRTGGPRAWRERQEQQKEFSRSFDEEPPKNNDVDSDEEVDPYDARDPPSEYDLAEVETELEKEERGGGETDQDEINGDEFTMPMMLKSINVDLSLIGYDRDNQRWAD